MSPSGKVHGPRPADSAGVGWEGRDLTAQPFAGDDGSASSPVAAALAELAAARSAQPATDPDVALRAQAAVVAALAGTRLLVPIVAVLGEGGEAVAAEGDRNAEMALVTLIGRDGRRALPAFTSVATCALWDPAARPVPARAERAAAAALEEGFDVVVLDPGGPVTLVLGRQAVRALGSGCAWTPAPFDDAVRAAVVGAVTGLPAVLSAQCEAGRSAETGVVLTLTPGLTRAQLDDVVARAGERLAASDVVADRVDSIELRLVSG